MVSPTLRFTTPAGPAEGEYLVLGHSLGTSAVLWEDALPALEQSFRVIRWELPGHGQAPRAQDAFTIGELSDAIVEHLASLGASSFFYAGDSIGGTVGLDLALRYPDRVRAAVIISAGGQVNADVWRERAATVRAEGTESLAAGSTQRWVAPSTRDKNPDAVERLISALRATDDESYALACEALAAYDVLDRLSEVQTPVLAVWGEFDQLVPEEKSAEIARGVQRGQIQRVEGAAHTSPIEQPSDVAGRLISFFSTAAVEPR